MVSWKVGSFFYTNFVLCAYPEEYLNGRENIWSFVSQNHVRKALFEVMVGFFCIMAQSFIFDKVATGFNVVVVAAVHIGLCLATVRHTGRALWPYCK